MIGEFLIFSYENELKIRNLQKIEHILKSDKTKVGMNEKILSNGTKEILLVISPHT